MFEGILEPAHLLLILFVALLVFGPQKIPELGKALGQSIREFKKAISSANHDGRSSNSATPQLVDHRNETRADDKLDH